MKLSHMKQMTTSAINESLKALKIALNARVKNHLDNLSFQQIEHQVQQIFLESARSCLEGILSGYNINEQTILFEGCNYRRTVTSTKSYQSVVGPLSVERTIYRDRKTNKSLYPLECLSGIVEGFWTPKAANIALLYMTELPSDRTKNLLGEVGLMQPSTSSLDRLPKKISAHWESQRDLSEQQLRNTLTLPETAVSLAVSLDGVLIPTRCTRVIASDSRYEEASCGALVAYDAEGQCVWKKQYGRMPEHKKRSLKSSLTADLQYILSESRDLTIVKVADGARENWDYLSQMDIKGREVLDFYHASEHLKRAFDIAYGENNIKSIQSFSKYRDLLLNDEKGAKKVISHLSYLTRKMPTKKLLKTEHGYFQRNAKRCRYAQLQSENLPIGSGVVEAICKTLVTQRLKCAGMRWDYDGGQAILTFRALSHSKLFGEAWNIVNKNYHFYFNAANDCGTLPLFDAA